MASNASVPARGLPPRPPDKGSFPLDHFRECSDAKAKYIECLRANSMQADSEECRQLSAAYLQCRMDTCVAASPASLLSSRTPSCVHAPDYLANHLQPRHAGN